MRNTYQDITIQTLNDDQFSLSDIKGTDLKRFTLDDLNLVPVFKVLRGTEDPVTKYPILYSINPYGDTIFNIYQCDKLLEELKTIYQNFDISEQKRIIDLLDSIIKDQDRRDSVRYLLFRGD